MRRTRTTVPRPTKTSRRISCDTAVAITGVIGFVLVLAPFAQLLPGTIGTHIHAYLPSEAGSLIVSPHQGPNDLLSPWQGMGVFVAWTAILMLVAMFALKRRDV